MRMGKKEKNNQEMRWNQRCKTQADRGRDNKVSRRDKTVGISGEKEMLRKYPNDYQY